MIAGIGKKNELGVKNTLLWNLPADMKHFREMTSGHPVIMGQKTYESIGRPLPNRRNIILTHDLAYHPEDTEVVHSIDELLELCKKENSDEEFFVIGGGMIYAQLIDMMDMLYITHVDASFPEADAFFPEIKKSLFQEVSREEHEADEKNIYPYAFTEYKKKTA
jgi:dihydrofolate reductase